jgi:hypothetical protein
MDYKDVFAWDYKELKGIPKEICEHKIELMVDAQLIIRQYKMNPNYALKVIENLDRLPDIGFIYLVKTIQWYSTLVDVPKKNDKLCICVDYHKMNVQMKKIYFLHLF